MLTSRIRFDEKFLCELFNKFQGSDLLNKNEGLYDNSTMFNMIASDFLVRNFPYVLKAKSRVVVSTIIPKLSIKDTPRDF